MMTINGRTVFLVHMASSEDPRGDHLTWDRFVRLVPLGTRVKGIAMNGTTHHWHADPHLRPVSFNIVGQEGVLIGAAESDHKAVFVGPTSSVNSIERKMRVQFFASAPARDIDAINLLYFIGGRWRTVGEVLASVCPDCCTPVERCTCWPDEPHDGPWGG